MSSILSKVGWNRLAAIVVCATSVAAAQVGTAKVAGIIEDATGARVAGAVVKLINIQTGTENVADANSYGVFLLPSVIPGDYTLQIAKIGFATAQFTGIVLNIGDAKRFLIRMEISAVNQTVTINAAGVSLNTSDGSMGTVVNRRFIQNMSLNGRSLQDLITMAPGVLTESPQNAGVGDFSINGQRPDTNSYIVDGVSADTGTGSLLGPHKTPGSGDDAGTTALGTTQGIVPLDALQEFRVLSSSYPAEYGRTLGAQFALVTRAGTNALHGSLYDYLRNDIFDARDWFTQFNSAYIRDISFHQEDFGGMIGGPVTIPGLYNGRDNTFFYASHETLIVFQPSAPLVQYTPDYLLHAQAPPAVRAVIGSFPLPVSSGSGTPIDATPGLAPYTRGAITLPGSLSSTDIRLDHVFSSKASAFIRLGDTPSDSQTINLSSLSQIHMRTRSLTVGASTQIGSRSNNNFRWGYARANSHLGTSIDPVYPFDSLLTSTDFNELMGFSANNATAAAEIYIRIPGIGESYINTDRADSSLRQWNLTDTYSFHTGQHFINFGIDQRHVVSAMIPPPVSLRADYLSRASLLENRADDVAVTKNDSAAPVFNEFAAYAQDDWHILKNLSLSVGLRWEVDPPPSEAHGKNAYTLLGNIYSPTSLALASRGTPLWHTSWDNLAPRLGAAWTIDNHPERELVLRAGGGVFYGTDNHAAVEAFNGAGFSATSYSTNTPIPVPKEQFDFPVNASAAFRETTAFAFSPSLGLPYTLQWNLSLEKALGRNQTITTAYVGASGHRLLQERIKDVADKNPILGDVGYFPSGLTSNFQSFQVRFRRYISPGLQVLTSYAWSHALDYGSTDPRYPLTYGTSDFDVRHNMQAAFVWDMRPISGGWFRKGALSGWGMDARVFARTAFPLTVLGNLNTDPITGEHYYSGSNLIPGKSLYMYGSQYPGGRAVNGGPRAVDPAFESPEEGAAGNAPRNLLRGFDDFQVNLALRKAFHLYGRFGLQFRAETFNLFNHPDLGYIDPKLTDELFGQSTLLLNQSFSSTGPLYQQGSPRSLQFATKLTF